MKKDILKIWLTTLIILWYSHQGIAQINDTLLIVKPMDPVIKQSEKIKDHPDIKDTSSLKLSPQYSFIEIPYQTRRIIDTIAPVKVKSESVAKIYPFYIKAAAGNNMNKYLLASFSSTRNKNQRFSLQGEHFSSEGLSSINYDNNSYNKLSAQHTVCWEEASFSSDVSYQRQAFHYYGITDWKNKNISVTDSRILLNKYQYFMSHFQFQDNLPEVTLNLRHRNALSFIFTTDDYEAKEYFFKYNSQFGKQKNKDFYLIDFYADFNAFSYNQNAQKNGLLKILPHVQSQNKRLYTDIGIHINMQFDSIARYYFFPQAEIKYEVVKNAFIPFVRIEGNLIRHHFFSFTQKNPYLLQSIPIYNAIEKFSVTAGWRVAFSRWMYFTLDGQFRRIDQMPLWVKKYSDALQNRFIPVYDNMDWLKIRFHLAYDKGEHYKIGLYTYFNDYRTATEIKAWHMPTFEYGAWFLYNIADKIILKSTLYGIDKQYVKKFNNHTPISEKLNGYADGNIIAEYRYSSKVSVFLHLNNILSQSYQRWQDYNVQRFNVLCGFTFIP